MSKMRKYAVKKTAIKVKAHADAQESAVTNYMGGTSYTINPLDTLRIVVASSIFGEPSYYRGSHDGNSYLSAIDPTYSILAGFVKGIDAKSTTDVFTSAIDNALMFDYKGTIDLAVRLRNEFNMRLNPSVILTRAAISPKRLEIFKAKRAEGEAPIDFFRKALRDIVKRPDDITNMFEYWMFLYNAKNKIPNVMKKAWADKLSKFTPYQLNKYKANMLIDLVRISHAKSENITALLKNTLEIKEDEQTWEMLRSDKKSWDEIIDTIKIPHMALLRNLRGIFSEGTKYSDKILSQLKEGVPTGKQFPYRYYSAYNVIVQEHDSILSKGKILDTLEECIDIAMVNFPKLTGRTISLVDNSGSTHGDLTSEYGSVRVSDIANLSGIMTGVNSDEGFVGIFGDRLKIYEVSKRNGILSQLTMVNEFGSYIGGSTENGIWLFFDKAIRNKVSYDNIFIYSDQQAGHGGLYGINPSEYRQFQYHDTVGGYGNQYIDVMKLVQVYREKVNAKVNIFSVQVAGYDNTVLPENMYRTAILAGWTGKEVIYASEMNKFWDEKDNQK